MSEWAGAEDLRVRAAEPGDRHFLEHSWLRSYAEGRDFGRVPREVFFPLYTPTVRRLLDQSETTILYLDGAPDSVVGYTVSSGLLLHYVLVKPRWRRLGLARVLLQPLGPDVTYTHAFPSWYPLPTTWTYDPRRRFDV